MFNKLPRLPYALCLCLIPTLIPAQTMNSTFTGGAGNWLDDFKWSPAEVPNNTDTTTYHVWLDGGDSGNSILTLVGTNPTITSMTISSGDELIIETQYFLTIDGGELDNNGTLSIRSGFHQTGLIFENDAQLNGSGEILMRDDSPGNQILLTDDSQTLTNYSAHTIRGSGKILNNVGGFSNSGTIVGFGTGTLTFDPGAGGLYNNGSIASEQSNGTIFLGGDYTNVGDFTARDGGKLTFNGANLDNSAGSIMVTQGTIELLGGTISGGTISGVPDLSTIQINQKGQTLTNVYNDIDVIQAGDADIIVNDSFTFSDNEWTIQPTSLGTEIKSTVDTTFDGTGTISAQSGTYHLIYGDNVTQTFGENLTIQGAGNLGNNKGGLLINGTVLANRDQEIVIDPNDLGCVINGTLSTTGTGGLWLRDGSFTNNTNPLAVGAGSSLRLSNNAVMDSPNAPVNLTDDGKLELNSSSLTCSAVNNPGTNAALVDITGGNNTLNIPTIDANIDQRGASDVNIEGDLEQNGDWNMEAATLGMDVRFVGDATYSGPGTLNCSKSVYHRIFSDGGTLTIESPKAVRGAGTLCANVGGLINNGAIIADRPEALIINPNELGVTNNGSLIVGGGTLTITDGTVDNTTNTISVGPASLLSVENGAVLNSPTAPIAVTDDGRISLASSTITGNSITEAGTGEGQLYIHNSDNYLNVQNIETDIVQVNGGDVEIDSDLTHNGDWTMQSATIGMDVKFIGDQTFDGTGTLTANSGNYHMIYADGGTLTMGADRTVEGGIRVCNNRGGMINNGTLHASNGAMTIDPNGLGFINNGHLIASSEEGMIIQDGVATNTSNPIQVNARSAITVRNNGDLQGETQPINLENSAQLRLQDGRVAASQINGTDTSSVVISNSNNTLSVPVINVNIDQKSAADVEVQGDLEHNATWSMQGSTLGMDAAFEPGAIFGGSGEMIMRSFTYHKVYAENGLLIHDLGHTIRGYGKICDGKGGLENYGLIRAEGDTQTLRIEPNSLGSLNLGSWEVGPNARMHVYNTLATPFNNMYQNAELIDGIYTVEGDLRIANANINVLSALLILIGPDATVTGNDTLSIIDELNTISNQGALDLRDGHILETTVASGSFLHRGGLFISNGSELRINTTFDQRLGFVQLDQGTLSPTGTYMNSVGELKGTGTVNASVTNNVSRTEPGLDANTGTLVINGDYTIDFFSTLAMDITGTAPGEFDVLSVNTANLDGYFEGRFPTGYNPPVGTRFPVLEADVRNQTFKFLTGTNIANGPYFILEYSPTGAELVITDIYVTSQEVINHLRGYITLTGAKALLADDNGDGQLDAADVASLINKGL